MKNEIKRETAKIISIKEALLKAKSKGDVLSIVDKFQGSIHSTYTTCNGIGGWAKVLARGEIVFDALSDYEEYMGRIIYRSKGSLFFSGNNSVIPSFRLPQDTVDLIMEVF